MYTQYDVNQNEYMLLDLFICNRKLIILLTLRTKGLSQDADLLSKSPIQDGMSVVSGLID